MGYKPDDSWEEVPPMPTLVTFLIIGAVVVFLAYILAGLIHVIGPTLGS